MKYKFHKERGLLNDKGEQVIQIIKTYCSEKERIRLGKKLADILNNESILKPKKWLDNPRKGNNKEEKWLDNIKKADIRKSVYTYEEFLKNAKPTNVFKKVQEDLDKKFRKELLEGTKDE